MGRKHQNGGVVGARRIYYDAMNTGVHDLQTVYDSFSGGPTNREGFNKGLGFTTGVPAGTYPILTGAFNNSTTTQSPVNIYYRRAVFGSTYTTSELNSAFSSAGGSTANITAMRLYVVSAPVYQPLPNYAVGLTHTVTDANNVNPTINSNRVASSLTTVYGPQSTSFSGASFFQWNFSTPFVWNGVNGLGVIWAWGQCPTTWNRSGVSRYTNVGTSYYVRTDSSGSYSVTDTGTATTAGRPSIEFIVS